MLSVDDTSFVKKGIQPGVKRQYCGYLGKTENCQLGVSLAYAVTKGKGVWIMTCTFQRNGSAWIILGCVRKVISQKEKNCYPK